jgi:DNA-binding transcriptional ArsR family regulator
MKKQGSLLHIKQKKVLDFVKILADEERFKIVYLLHLKTYCVCELGELLNLPQNLVSYHLKILKDFNLVTFKKSGRKSFYPLNKKQLSQYLKLLNKNLTK